MYDGQRNHHRPNGDLRLDDVDDGHAGNAEYQRSRQTDTSLQIETVVTVIPPSRVEHLLHGPGSDVFEYARSDCGDQENHDRIMHIVQQCDRQCRAGSVNRAQRAIEEAAIHQPAFHDGHQNRFVDPADETVQYEPKEEMLQR